MKTFPAFLFFFFLIFSNLVFSQQMQYVFFLHNKFLEGHSFTEQHPQYGIAEYKPILAKLKSKNTVVISEKRAGPTDPKVYAKKIVSQIDSLQAKGIPSKNITVIGTSQGGYIAQYVSYYAKNSDLKFVLIGASFKDDSLNEDPDFRLYGKILSITEKSDDNREALSQQKRYLHSKLKGFKEIELNTGLNHGFLFKALDEWINPAKDWINKTKF
ncbi:pimeloyl-ACP methyl ester carboxylesterase [Chryseobacterium sp. H1D6B]|uniref:alpha/beta hydrolase n=1 Tax=Chryseobacterium sp. H1D6B TaxID=2940588 RepID=UPI0015CD9239|nr:alpha/beta hydrolase [Chryseobacterium sp. H1D6B]MDH6250283.1 pimeloyl-ACP methyl ester carboxylesterase [Chryseobacterium sp. H1D6B]